MRAEKIIRLRMQNSTFCRRIPVVQGDTARTFRFILEDITLDGTEHARIYARKPSGAEIYDECDVIGSNEVIFTPETEQIFIETGIIPAEIRVAKGEKLITSYSFEFEVRQSAMRTGDIPSSDEFNALERAIEEAKGLHEPEFTEAGKRENIVSGETMQILFGKIKKWFTDMGALIIKIGNKDISSIGDGTVTGAITDLDKRNTKNTSDIDIERKRIDNIAKLPEGATTGDAELADIRVAADGTSYDTAGEAVRGQINQIDQKYEKETSSLKEDLNTIRDDLNNITVGGVTSGFVRALQELFSAVAYWDSSKITNPSAKISALSSYIGGGSGNPSGSATVTGIAVVWSATSADVGTDPKTLITSVTAEYSDGTSKVVTSYSVNISSLVLGENNVVVSCLGFTDSKTITGNKVVNSLLSNLRSYKINVLLEPSYTIVSSGNTHTIDWNPDYTGNKIFQNGRAIGNCNIQKGKTYKVSTSEKITDAVHLYGFDVSVSGSEIDDVQSSPGTMVTTFQSGTKEVTFTASADFGYLRLAPVNCPITLYDLVVEEV